MYRQDKPAINVSKNYNLVVALRSFDRADSTLHDDLHKALTIIAVSEKLSGRRGTARRLVTSENFVTLIVESN